MSFLHFFDWTYYFDSNLSMTFLGWGYWIIVALLVLMIIAGQIVPRRTKKLQFLQRQLVLRSAAVANVVGWVGLLWLVFRYEGIKYFSWRLWAVLLVLYVLIQVGLMIKYAKFDFPAKRASKVSGQEKDKYLKRYLRK